jgi:hypothetical protein
LVGCQNLAGERTERGANVTRRCRLRELPCDERLVLRNELVDGVVGEARQHGTCGEVPLRPLDKIIDEAAKT